MSTVTLACRQVGGTADRIVLWPLGGVAYVNPPPRPGATLWSIAAGPLVNVVLVPILSLLGIVSRSLGWAAAMPDFQALLRAVWFINFGLLIFNMLPIYPLDGGQILRSLLWYVLGRARSLMVAASIGLSWRGRFHRPDLMDAVSLVWAYLRVHADELLDWTKAGAGIVTLGEVAASRWICLPALQNGAAAWSVLEMREVRTAVRHVPNPSGLSALCDSI